MGCLLTLNLRKSHAGGESLRNQVLGLSDVDLLQHAYMYFDMHRERSAPRFQRRLRLPRNSRVLPQQYPSAERCQDLENLHVTVPLDLQRLDGRAREVAEMALAHAVSDKVEAAYRRGDLFGKRRQLMNDWAAFCGKWQRWRRQPGNV